MFTTLPVYVRYVAVVVTLTLRWRSGLPHVCIQLDSHYVACYRRYVRLYGLAEVTARTLHLLPHIFYVVTLPLYVALFRLFVVVGSRCVGCLRYYVVRLRLLTFVLTFTHTFYVPFHVVWFLHTFLHTVVVVTTHVTLLFSLRYWLLHAGYVTC